MKKKLFVITSLSILVTSSIYLSIKGNNHKFGVDAYSGSSLPTTIDLNDSTAEEVRNYYSSLNGLSTSERQGDNLLKNLKRILKDGQKYCTYDGSNMIWQLYEIADRDWEKSPASSIQTGTYNPSTNKITGYKYGQSYNNPYIHALYINRDVDNETLAWGNHNQDMWGINREHVWPKSLGFEYKGDNVKYGARGDPMHLMAGNGWSNKVHSNYFYGYVDTSISYTDCGNDYSNQKGNLLGRSKTVNKGTVFEPQDSDKGDIARAIFYMAARYNYFESDSDDIDCDNPNLRLTQDINDFSSTSYTSTETNPGKVGILSDLLAWHHADPVDEYEIHRNNLLFKNYTNNRNPFIDFPEWADYIWGEVQYSGSTYISYSSTPTGYAKPSSDSINQFNNGDTPTVISVTGVNLEEDNISLLVGNSQQLTATVSPNNATNKAVTWSSDNEDVASVSDSGLVNAHAVGTATIIVTTADGDFTDTCTVTVTEPSGDEGVVGGSINAADGQLPGWAHEGIGTPYSDGSVKLDSSGDYIYGMVIFDSEISNNIKSLSVTINGKINGTPQYNNSYKVEAIDEDENTLNSVTKTGSDVFTTNYGDQTFTMDSSLTGCRGIRITYERKGTGNWGIKSVSWEITYTTEPELPWIESIEVKTAPDRLEYVVGDDFEPQGLVIRATYSDSSISDFVYEEDPYSFEFYPSENLQVDDTSITIYYAGMSCTQDISVSSFQYLNPIYVDSEKEVQSDLVFEAACGGSGTTNDNKHWDITSDAAESNFDSNKGIHYGTGKLEVGYIQLSSSDYQSNKIGRVVVSCSGASGVSGFVSVTIDGVPFGATQSFNSTAGAYYTFDGDSEGGDIVVRIYKSEPAVKAIYCKYVSVFSLEKDDTQTNIANVTGHENAQNLVARFAKAFNRAMDNTNGCKENLSSTWNDIIVYWNEFLTNAKALGEDEELYAMNLVKYAKAKWTENTDNNHAYCLERALATYERCVNAYGLSAFMSDIRSVSSSRSINTINDNNTSLLLVAILSTCSILTVACIYFKKRKLHN